MLEEIGNLDGYELLDSGITESGEGERLERFGDFVLVRPDPAALWQKKLSENEWQNANAIFRKRGSSDSSSNEGDEIGNWQIRGKVPEKWLMNYEIPHAVLQNDPSASDKISFYAKLTPFKHTGIFPEQVSNWNFISEKFSVAASSVRNSTDENSKDAARPKFLNLFGYTGIASVLAAKLGFAVTHVDASKPSITWAKENMLLSALPEDAIRWIFDDALKFVKREVNRGNKYDAILLDPPAFGRGPKGEVWKFNEGLPVLLSEIRKILSNDFRFVIVNAYAVSVSALLLKNMLEDFGFEKRKIDYGELILRESGKDSRGAEAQKKDSGRKLSTGIFARLY